jgi:uncharacterized protein
MKKPVLILLICCFTLGSFAQKDSAAINDIKSFQEELLHEYADPALSPIKPESAAKFKGIHFFDIDTRYIVTAKFTRTPNEKIFEMATSGDVKKQYVKYGIASFSLLGQEYKLSLYQSIALLSNKKYRNYLFIPFRDASSGKETYGAGRYIDVLIPEGEAIVINFNKAYHPYCAYTGGYNCPIPPRENYIPVKVLAGVKL